MRRGFQLDGRTIEMGGECFIIGEVAQAHDGSLGMAHAYIDAVAGAGADAVKFQTHIADAESTSREPFRIRSSDQDGSRLEYWRRMEFTEDQWRGLARHAAERGLVFLSSPFSIDALEILLRVGIAAWKIPSGEVTNVPLLERALATGKPLLISTGMSSIAEIDALMQLVAGTDVLLFQTTSAYPTPPEDIGLRLIPEFRRRYECPVGLSDHSGTIFAGLGAVMGGLEALEVHVTFDRRLFGPDVSASITIDELGTLIGGVRFLERARDGMRDKDIVTSDLAPLRLIFGRSVVAVRDIAAGTVLSEEDLACKKPGGGLPPERLRRLIGRRTTRALRRDEAIAEHDVE